MVQKPWYVKKTRSKLSYVKKTGHTSFAPARKKIGVVWRSEAPRPCDEGMTNGPPIFAYLVFDPGRVSLERLLRPVKAAV
jgi:hypothetical protein